MDRPGTRPLNSPPGRPPLRRPVSLPQAKALFALTVESAAGRALGRASVKHLMVGAFAVGVTLGVSPGARKALGAMLLNLVNKRR